MSDTGLGLPIVTNATHEAHALHAMPMGSIAYINRFAERLLHGRIKHAAIAHASQQRSCVRVRLREQPLDLPPAASADRPVDTVASSYGVRQGSDIPAP